MALGKCLLSYSQGYNQETIEKIENEKILKKVIFEQYFPNHSI
jgi:hypothetical protein